MAIILLGIGGLPEAVWVCAVVVWVLPTGHARHRYAYAQRAMLHICAGWCMQKKRPNLPTGWLVRRAAGLVNPLASLVAKKGCLVNHL